MHFFHFSTVFFGDIFLFPRSVYVPWIRASVHPFLCFASRRHWSFLCFHWDARSYFSPAFFSVERGLGGLPARFVRSDPNGQPPRRRWRPLESRGPVEQVDPFIGCLVLCFH